VSHVWGYRNYDTPDDSRNNWLVALLAAGEGWHNNHHADPVSPRHGHKWWEIDAAWWAIRALMLLGLARPRRAARSDGAAAGS
jgi:stearoyl-CoA desaturase (delta-9 desaturase)